jgi:TIR domain-containing protein
MKTFISYRREDARGTTERLSGYLADQFGPGAVFRDVNDILPGADFRSVLLSTLDTCDSLIAIIGPQWSTIADRHGRPRITDPNDYVHIEVVSALARGIPVIPVLVDGAAMPNSQDLPSDLQGLVARQALLVRYDPDFHADRERLSHFLIELHLINELLCQSESTLPSPGPLPIEEEPVFQSCSEAIADNSRNTVALLMRGQMAYTWARACGGHGYRQAVEDFRRCAAIDSSLSDPHLGLGTVYYDLAIFDVVRRNRYSIHEKGKVRLNKDTGLLEMKAPTLELFFDDQCRSVQALALKELQAGLSLRQHSRKIEEATSVMFHPADVMKRLTSLRRMLGLLPMTTADDTMFMVFSMFYTRLCEAGTAGLFEPATEADREHRPRGPLVEMLRNSLQTLFGLKRR